jgi:hypothetical protein
MEWKCYSVHSWLRKLNQSKSKTFFFCVFICLVLEILRFCGLNYMNLNCFQDWFIEWNSARLCCPFLYQARLFSLQYQDISLSSSPFVCLSIFLFEWICKALCNGSFQKVFTRWGFLLHINVFNEMFLGIYWATFCDRWRTRYIKLLITSTLFWLNFEKFSNVKCDLFFGWSKITSPWAFQICCVCLCAICEGITNFWTTSST